MSLSDCKVLANKDLICLFGAVSSVLRVAPVHIVGTQYMLSERPAIHLTGSDGRVAVKHIDAHFTSVTVFS